ncbi:outer membrane beta-barrel protein [Flavihumibacter sp. RY-1]|uniref:Outer membrane beta-barrel protein n=1 Tax=Flavihumibacter fluminis TaxID=2909236 RepID=A0ABS9BHV2_9BACT|nr:outer membrane beta-barrel protein [Flavihumibacter fluminis]MCF1715288.1 outer membrane beta-barrel protein [Flavihumibacter fluminis]
MKKLLVLLAFTALSIGAMAQSNQRSIRAYGAGIAELTTINGKPSLNLGGYGGVLINHKFLIGAAGNNAFFRHKVNGKEEKMQFNYYGLYSEYRFMPEKPVHFSVGLTGAMGWAENDIKNDSKTARRDGDYTWVVQPKLGVNIKITRFMQVQAYANYRFTGNTNSAYYEKSNFNGVGTGVGLVFGSF